MAKTDKTFNSLVKRVARWINPHQVNVKMGGLNNEEERDFASQGIIG